MQLINLGKRWKLKGDTDQIYSNMFKFWQINVRVVIEYHQKKLKLLITANKYVKSDFYFMDMKLNPCLENPIQYTFKTDNYSSQLIIKPYPLRLCCYEITWQMICLFIGLMKKNKHQIKYDYYKIIQQRKNMKPQQLISEQEKQTDLVFFFQNDLFIIRFKIQGYVQAYKVCQNPQGSAIVFSKMIFLFFYCKLDMHK